MKKLILASTSRYRKELLNRLGIEFSCVAPDVDEYSYKNIHTDPVQLAQVLSKAKAEAVLARNPDSVVIGSDQVAHYGEKVLGKAGTIDKARDQLNTLVGNTHNLVTAVTICDSQRSMTFYDLTVLRMKKLSEGQINFYLSLDNPIDCAGSYKLEQYGIGLFDEIKSDDHTAIVGLPLIKTSQVLASFGIPVFSK